MPLDHSPQTAARRLLTFGARRPRAALTAWLAVTVALAIVGLGVGRHLSGTSLLVPGSESAREAQLFQREFGDGVSAPILLTGPRRALDRQGPALVARLSRLAGARVVSGWDAGSLGASLRPSPTRALVLVAVDRGARTSILTVERELARTVRSSVTRPVRAQATGVDAIGAQLQSSSLRAVHEAELIAIPILLAVLLVVFGSPLAATIPAVLGFGTVAAGDGVISLLGSLMPLTVLATTAASMMGLALGVDYSLLLVARFRDELRDPDDPTELRRAAQVAALRAGRTVAFAGGAIAILMLCALAVAAGTLLLSAVIGVIVVAAVAVAGTILAAPAALVLVGRRVAGRGVRNRAAAGHPPISVRLGRAPLAAAALVALVAVGAEALSLPTGAPDAGQLPAGGSAARAYAEVSRSVGTGWVTPFELLVVARHGAITTLPRLDALARIQRLIARDHDVVSVVGPAELAKRARPLAHAEASVASTNRNLSRSAAVIGGLNNDLGQAASGASRVRGGFAAATAAMQSLASGSAGGSASIGALRTGLEQAAAGSRQIDTGLTQAAAAAGRIAGGSQRIATGAGSLAAALSTDSATAAAAQPRLAALAQTLHTDAATLGGLSGTVGQLDSGPAGAATQLDAARAALDAMRLGRFDPRYRQALDAVEAAQAALAATPSATALAARLGLLGTSEQQSSGQAAALAIAAGQLSRSAAQLQLSVAGIPAEIAALQRGQRALAAGIERLASNGTAISAGLGSLSAGTATLSARLQALQGGAARVASGLSTEQRQAGALTAALSAGRRHAASGAASAPGHSTLLGTLARNPGFFGSGYLVLAALEGSAAARRAGVDFIVNVDHDGQAARLLVVPRSPLRAAATGALRRRLERLAPALAAATGARVLVGGPAAQLRDYAAAATNRVPLLIGVLMAATFALLVVVFRSLLAPLAAVLLNLLSVAASFGILSLLAGGRRPPIGGPGYVDALSVSAMFAVVFALSLDYQVFLLMRMREGWLRTGSTAAGVDYGVARTARVVAGAAAIMAGVFLAFAGSEVATIRQLGVGLAVAIVLDATVVRLILLPAALRLGGRATWWLPGWLERVLPVVDIGGERRACDRAGGERRASDRAGGERRASDRAATGGGAGHRPGNDTPHPAPDGAAAHGASPPEPSLGHGAPKRTAVPVA